MKLLPLLLTLTVLVSCSSAKTKKSLAEKIQAEEARSLAEISSHSETLLEEHPELDERMKSELRPLLLATMRKHQELKDEESKIFQLLLEKSFRINQLSPQDLKDKSALKSQLKDLYERKSENVLSLINRIVDLTKNQTIEARLQSDLMFYMRDFR